MGADREDDGPCLVVEFIKPLMYLGPRMLVQISDLWRSQVHVKLMPPDFLHFAEQLLQGRAVMNYDSIM